MLENVGFSCSIAVLSPTLSPKERQRISSDQLGAVEAVLISIAEEVVVKKHALTLIATVSLLLVSITPDQPAASADRPSLPGLTHRELGSTAGSSAATGAGYGWGDNFYGQLGDGSSNNSSTAVAVKLATNVASASVSAGQESEVLV